MLCNQNAPAYEGSSFLFVPQTSSVHWKRQEGSNSLGDFSNRAESVVYLQLTLVFRRLTLTVFLYCRRRAALMMLLSGMEQTSYIGMLNSCSGLQTQTEIRALHMTENNA